MANTHHKDRIDTVWLGGGWGGRWSSLSESQYLVFSVESGRYPVLGKMSTEYLGALSHPEGRKWSPPHLGGSSMKWVPCAHGM